ncbi:hypothetical protein FPOA_06815 [Fusarium poae]|uniref:Uncharacterized protein n=1 Tax=Fusarium poae TaxID=36050 RepID=A0A1B8AJH2_FUSPO|nr:hypothetical protein FPOA_06815 [Fusarium poae]
MTSTFSSANWKGCFGRYASPYSLYRYKECPTPETYAGQQKIQAFELDYDRHSKSTSLQHDQQSRDGIAVEFSNTGTLPQVSKVDKTIGWYFDEQGLADFLWRDLKSVMEEEAQTEMDKKKKFDWVRENEGHLYGINRLWAIRGYFIGPDKNNAPPCITVLCANEDVARFLVDRIHSKLHLHKGWGATRLPGVKVLKFGSSAGSDDDSYYSDKSDSPDIPYQNLLDGTADREAEKNLIRIEIESLNNHTMPTMTSGDLSSWALKRHRCGVQVEIVRESKVIAKATIGGLIIVGDEVYGLTVGHLFSSSASNGEAQRRLSAETVTTMNTWQESEACGMEFDWALVKIPGLQKQDVDSWMDVNLVQTVSGEFRPVLMALEEPSPYTHVVLATPGSTRCLRGVFIGSAAIVNIPESPTPYATWVCRMEPPWLIQPGDSGSWVLDAANGMLLGVLVAGCPELQEAYIIPAHEIIDDIKRHHPDDPDLSVNLPNCHPLSRSNQIDLQWHINEYGSIVKTFEKLDSLKGLLEVDSRINKWTQKAKAFTDIPQASYNLREEIRSEWRSALSVLNIQNSIFTEHDIIKERFISKEPEPGSYQSKLMTAIQQPPLRCYNFMNEKFVDRPYRHENIMLLVVRRCLILGLSKYSPNHKDVPEATRSAYDLLIKGEDILMKHKTSADYPGIRSPWEGYFIQMSSGKDRGVFPWFGHAPAYMFPRGYLNTQLYWQHERRIYRSKEMQMRGGDWPPWDRLTATDVLDRLSKDLQAMITVQRKGVEISLPETKMLDLPFVSQRLNDCDMVLFAIKLIQEDDTFLVTLPPPCIGPTTCTEYGISGDLHPKYYASKNAITYSCWRLPFILTNKTVPDEENLELLVSKQLNIPMSTVTQLEKLDIHHDHSRFYLEEYNQFVDVVIYKGHVQGRYPTMEYGLAGWLMGVVNESRAKRHLSPPFSAILDFGDD